MKLSLFDFLFRLKVLATLKPTRKNESDRVFIIKILESSSQRQENLSCQSKSLSDTYIKLIIYNDRNVWHSSNNVVSF